MTLSIQGLETLCNYLKTSLGIVFLEQGRCLGQAYLQSKRMLVQCSTFSPKRQTCHPNLLQCRTCLLFMECLRILAGKKDWLLILTKWSEHFLRWQKRKFFAIFNKFLIFFRWKLVKFYRVYTNTIVYKLKLKNRIEFNILKCIIFIMSASVLKLPAFLF